MMGPQTDSNREEDTKMDLISGIGQSQTKNLGGGGNSNLLNALAGVGAAGLGGAAGKQGKKKLSELLPLMQLLFSQLGQQSQQQQGQGQGCRRPGMCGMNPAFGLNGGFNGAGATAGGGMMNGLPSLAFAGGGFPGGGLSALPGGGASAFAGAGPGGAFAGSGSGGGGAFSFAAAFSQRLAFTA